MVLETLTATGCTLHQGTETDTVAAPGASADLGGSSRYSNEKLGADILDVGANIGLFSLFCNLNLPQPPQPPALHGPHRGAAAGDAAQAGKGEGEVAQDGKGEAGRSAGGVPAGRARNRVFAFEPVPAIYQVSSMNPGPSTTLDPQPHTLNPKT